MLNKLRNIHGHYCNLILYSAVVFVQANPLASEPLPRVGTAAKNLVEVDLGFIHAFLASLSVIIVSELGDKTFFIAAILAMRNPRVTVFTGAMLALGLMTVLSGMYSCSELDPRLEIG